MKFSVIIPIYNMEKYIEETLNSLVKQFSKDDELILVNDGSTDDSLEICRKYKLKYNFIKIIDKKNSGSMDSWIKGVRESSGDYILFVDADDIVESNYFEIIKGACEKKPDLIMFDYFEMFKNKKNKIKINKINYGFYENDQLNYIKKNIIKNHNLFSFYRWNKVFKRKVVIDVIDSINIISTYYEDCLIGLLSLIYATSLLYIDKTIYNYRMRKSSISHNVKINSFNDNLKVEKEMEMILKKYNYTKKDIQLNHLYFLFQYSRSALKSNFKVKKVTVKFNDILKIKKFEKKITLLLYKCNLKRIFFILNKLRKNHLTYYQYFD